MSNARLLQGVVYCVAYQLIPFPALASLCGQVDPCSGRSPQSLTFGAISRLPTAAATVYLSNQAPPIFSGALVSAVDAWNSTTGTALTVTSAAIGIVAVEYISSGWEARGFHPLEWGRTEEIDGVRWIFINGNTRNWGFCPTPTGVGEYATVLCHEIGHALGLAHYDGMPWYQCLLGVEDGPEACTIMTACYEGGHCERPASLDEVAIRCLYQIPVPNNDPEWSYIKSLYGPCFRRQNSELVALSAQTNRLVWRKPPVPTAQTMIFRSTSGGPVVLVGTTESQETTFVDTSTSENEEYDYLVATTTADTLLDLGSSRAGLHRISENYDINYPLWHMLVRSGHLYCLNGDFVRKFSLADPAAPIEVDAVDPNYVTLLENLSISDDEESLFAIADDKLVIIDAGSLTVLSYFDLANSSNPFYDIVGHGDFAMVGTELALYAVGRNPVTQQWGVCGTYGYDSIVTGLDRVGDYLYVRRWYDGELQNEVVRVIHNPDGTCSFSLVCANNMGCWPQGVEFLEGDIIAGEASNGFAFATRNGAFVVLDVSDPSHPVVHREIDIYAGETPYPVKSYSFDDRYLYLLTSMSSFWYERGLHAYDLTLAGSLPVYAGGGSNGVSIGYGMISAGPFVYLSDKISDQPTVPGDGYTRLNTFKKAYMSAELGVSIRDALTGTLTQNDPAVMCPQGDGDHVVVDVAVDAAFVLSPPSTSTVSVMGPLSNEFGFSPSVKYADSAPTLQGGEYHATVTLESGQGCGDDSLRVFWDGTLLGFVPVHVKGVDVNMSGSSAGIVDLVDIAAYSAHHPSSVCDCVHARLYDQCFDFSPPDTSVGLADFAVYGAHHNHSIGGGSLLSSTLLPSEGGVDLSFSEDMPATGPARLRVGISLAGIEPFKLLFLKLKSGSGTYHLSQWVPAEDARLRSFGTQVNSGARDLILGIATNKDPIGGTFQVGFFEFVASDNAPATYEADDFELITADFLDAHDSPFGVSASNLNRRTNPVRFRDELAANYPNPFNPSTTVAFSLSRAAKVDVTIYDVRGARVRTLVSANRPAGVYRVAWDARDNRGSRVASGVYFCNLTTPHFKATKKMVLIR